MILLRCKMRLHNLKNQKDEFLNQSIILKTADSALIETK